MYAYVRELLEERMLVSVICVHTVSAAPHVIRLAMQPVDLESIRTIKSHISFQIITSNHNCYCDGAKFCRHLCRKSEEIFKFDVIYLSIQTHPLFYSASWYMLAT